MALPLELELLVHQLLTAQLLTQLHQELKTKVEVTDFKKNCGHGHLVSNRYGGWYRITLLQLHGGLMWGIGTNPDFVYTSDIYSYIDLTHVKKAGHDYRQALTCSYNNALLVQHWELGGLGTRLGYSHRAECQVITC